MSDNRVTTPAQTLVRDSFTMPSDEYGAFVRLDLRAMGLGIKTGKSALIRAGIRALERLDDVAFAEVVKSSLPLKPGRRVSK